MGEIQQHCRTQCEQAVRPKDDEAAKALKIKSNMAFATFHKMGSQIGHTCRNAFDRVAVDACSLGCRQLQSGNPIKNTPEIASHRRVCDGLKSKPPFPALFNACKTGVEAGSDHFSLHGKNLRAKVESLCASIENEDVVVENTQAETPVEKVLIEADQDEKMEIFQEEVEEPSMKKIEELVEKAIIDNTVTEENDEEQEVSSRGLRSNFAF